MTSSFACTHCGAALARTTGTCPSCGAPITPEQQAIVLAARAKRRARILWASLLLAGLAAASGLRVSAYFNPSYPFVPIEPSANPIAASIHVEKIFDEVRREGDGSSRRLIGVVVENQSENLISCIQLAARVFDAGGVQRSNLRSSIGCQGGGFALWPHDRAAEWFNLPQLAATERYDLVIAKVEQGAPATGRPPSAPLAVAIDPKLGITDVGPFLRHSVRATSWDFYGQYGVQDLVFEVTASGAHEVTDLAYELHVFDAAGQQVERAFVTAASAGADYRRLASLRPGQSRVLRVSANARPATREPMRWELVLTRFAAVRPNP